MPAAVVDTSVLLALVLEDDPLHEAALGLLGCVEEAVAPSIVVHELVWSLRRRGLKPRELRWAVLRLLGGAAPRIRVEPLQPGDILEALEEPKSYEDALVAASARRLGLPLATLDKRMARLARRMGVTLLSCPGSRRSPYLAPGPG